MGAFIDLTGKKFGDWTVESYAGASNWNCVCVCGNRGTINATLLKRGSSRGCGCQKRAELIGMKFGRLTVVEYAGKQEGQVMWRCRCDCGNYLCTSTHQLRGRKTRSCGCLQRDIARRNALKHGLHEKRLYGVWKSMKSRCLNPRMTSYKNYGGRGITVCDEWRDNFQAFYNWAMANGYDPNAPLGGCTIDRIDVNGNYCPENCRFVSMKVQSVNQRRTQKCTYNGEELSVCELAEKYKINVKTLVSRLDRGWSIEKAIETPARPMKYHI